MLCGFECPGYPVTHQTVKAPATLKGAVRLDALQTVGPRFVGPTIYQCEVAQVLDERAQCEQDLQILCQPADPVAMGELLCDKLTQCTLLWTANFVQHHDKDRMPDLCDWWVRIVF